MLYSNHMAVKKRYPKWPIVKYLFLIILLIIVVIIGTYRYKTTHPLSDPRFGFQYYKPTVLPNGFKITDKRIDIANPDGRLYGISADLNLRTEDWIYAIRESKTNSKSSPDSSSTSTTLYDYDPNSVGVTCKQVVSPKGQSYRLCHWIDYGRISVYEVNFIKGSTYINTQFPGTTKNTVPILEISNYVDGFTKAKAIGFKTVSGL